MYSIASLASTIFCRSVCWSPPRYRLRIELHRDRRAALQGGAVGDVLDGRAEYAGEVDAVVFVEPLVLDRDGRVLQVGGDFVPADGAAQFVGLDEPQAGAVGGEHLRGAVGEDRVQRREGRRRAGDVQDVADRGDRAEHERHREHAAADEQDAGWAGAVVPAPTLSCLPGHLLEPESTAPRRVGVTLASQPPSTLAT